MPYCPPFPPTTSQVGGLFQTEYIYLGENSCRVRDGSHGERNSCRWSGTSQNVDTYTMKVKRRRCSCKEAVTREQRQTGRDSEQGTLSRGPSRDGLTSWIRLHWGKRIIRYSSKLLSFVAEPVSCPPCAALPLYKVISGTEVLHQRPHFPAPFAPK